MWREHAAGWAALVIGVFVIGLCAVWSVLAQTLVTPACDLPTPPANVGYLSCPVPLQSPGD